MVVVLELRISWSGAGGCPGEDSSSREGGAHGAADKREEEWGVREGLGWDSAELSQKASHPD